MPRTFDVYTDASSPPDPTRDPRIRPEVFHSYVPPLSMEGKQTLDKVLGYTTVPASSEALDVDMDLFNSMPTNPTRGRDGASSSSGTRTRRGVNGGSSDQVILPTMFRNESYPVLGHRVAKRLRDPETPKRVPLAELPPAPLRKPTRLAPITPTRGQKSSRARKPKPTIGYHVPPVAGSASLAATAVPPHSPTNIGSTSQGSDLRTRHINPQLGSAREPARRSTGTCSSCGSRCPRCRLPKVKKYYTEEGPKFDTDFDESVRKMEKLVARGRSLKNTIPAIAEPSTIHGLPKAWRPKTEVEQWLEVEMAKGLNGLV